MALTKNQNQVLDLMAEGWKFEHFQNGFKKTTFKTDYVGISVDSLTMTMNALVKKGYVLLLDNGHCLNLTKKRE